MQSGATLESKGLQSRIAAIGLACMLMAAGCDWVGSTAQIEEGCKEHPMWPALPDVEAIGSRPLLWMDCPDSVRARYGVEDEHGDGDHCTVEILDMGVPVASPENTEGLGRVGAHAQGLMHGISRFNVEVLVKSARTIPQHPVLLKSYGGPNHLPAIGKTSTGDDYAIAVPRAGAEPQAEQLIAVIKERYSLNISCTEPIRNRSDAESLFLPYLNALHLRELP